MLHRLKFDMEDTGRVPSRVLQCLEHACATPDQLSFVRDRDRFHFVVFIDIAEAQLHRIESLLWKLHGMLTLTQSAASSLAADHDLNEVGRA